MEKSKMKIQNEPKEKEPPPGYNFHPDYRCKKLVIGQTGPGLGYERCNFRQGHDGECEP